jgi:autotransporter-associated beta strand protein
MTRKTKKARRMTPKSMKGTKGGIVKTGTGTLLLNSANTYTGATTVNSGTL